MTTVQIKEAPQVSMDKRLPDRKKHAIVSNPELLLLSAVKKIDDLFVEIKRQTGLDVADFEAYLKTREPQLMAKIDRAWRFIDCDIYDRFLNHNLPQEEWQKWKKTVFIWVSLVQSAIELYSLHRVKLEDSDVTLSSRAA